MGRWLALARADVDEKNLKTPPGGTDKTDETPAGEVSSVSSVRQTSVSEKISGPADGRSDGFVSFVSSPKGAFAENFAASAPAPGPVTRSPVAAFETPEAAVVRRMDTMAAENDRRRDWTKASPYEPDGSLVMRSALTGEGVTIYLPTGRTRH